MPLTHYRCPDNQAISITDCLSTCRLGSRCLTKSTLRVIAETQRPWDGIPHVTQLLNGTMLEYLKITRDYCIKPKDRAFALLGSSHHKMLEATMYEKGPSMMLEYDGFVSELELNIGWVQGTLDLIEREDNTMVMVDYKCWGSNRLCRGSKFDPSQVDLAEVSLQMNMYRIMAEHTYNWHIDQLQVQCTVRDGGLAVATKRGVTENMYLLPVSRLHDDVVLAYFQAKAKLLQDALAHKEKLPEPCSN